MEFRCAIRWRVLAVAAFAFCHRSRTTSSIKWTNSGQKDRNTNRIWMQFTDSRASIWDEVCVSLDLCRMPTVHYIRINLFRNSFWGFLRDSCFFLLFSFCLAHTTYTGNSSQQVRCTILRIPQTTEGSRHGFISHYIFITRCIRSTIETAFTMLSRVRQATRHSVTTSLKFSIRLTFERK